MLLASRVGLNAAESRILRIGESNVLCVERYDRVTYQRYPKSTKAKLAMKIGTTYRLHEIDAAQWRKWTPEELSPEAVIEIVQPTIQGIMKSLDPVKAAVGSEFDSRFLERLTNSIAERANHCSNIVN